jgi:hypothetical protein
VQCRCKTNFVALESTKCGGMQGIELGHPGTHQKYMASRKLVF